MTENDPHGQGPEAQDKPDNSAGNEYAAPNPWSAPSAHSEQQQQQQNPYATPGQPYYQPYQPGTAGYGTPQQHQPQPQRGQGGAGKLVAGVAVLALLVGGGAGAVGGYLASDGATQSASSLEAPQPARQTGNAPAGSVESVAQKVSPSVVQLQVAGRGGQANGGSGFVIDANGYVLTNNHVVENAANGGGQIQVVFQDGRKAPATVVGRDPSSDVAVVKAEGVSGLTPVELGRSDDLKVGQGVVAIGSPFELSGTVTSGIVSALHRPVRAGGEQGSQSTVMDAVQTDAAINPGNSGGPLANMDGQIIGINSAIYSPPSSGQQQGGNVGIGFAIPIDQARRTADEIIKTGQATQTFIGATVTDAQEGGASIREVTQGSPAEQAGLKGGDVVTKIDDRVVDSSDALVAAIRTKVPGDKVKLTLSSNNVIEVTLGGQPVPTN
ncbi:S1C family serine protease [Amycolatopsis magusensis]|uniref:Serine protease PepD n=1 Tax=Amycolatopsis magusensis TaxID=882444 RepID=A0ABS4PHK3_9PSEU|nr:trypsin-like peptidase domain-containing protein [Amycolatopsis magusensis]MBP2178897.1 putative serine protease PepD [Amycolatopsis magusensis]MDI5975279.1 trypsin-like peptidase domain-containing protein [Amycolatopsis magusensis]